MSKNNNKKHIYNHLFAEEYHYDGNFELDTNILLIQYNAEDLYYSKIDSITKNFQEHIKPGFINWFDITGLNNTLLVQKLLKEFGFYSVDAKPVLTPCHAAKIDEFGKRLIIVIQPCFFDRKHNIDSEHISILMKGNILLTFREIGNVSFDNVLKSLRTNLMNIRSEDTGMLLAFILNSILSVMIGTAIKVEEMLENIDRILLESEHADIQLGKKIQNCSNANLFLQKNSVPLKDEFDKLLNIGFIKNSETLPPVYMELYNQLDYVLLTSQNCNGLLASLRDLYVSNNELKTNSIMKRLTVLATFFIPITFLAGVWGMNFEFMPEIKWRYGYIIAWGVFAVTAIITWLCMKKNKWF